jgi:hypothetical protein
MDIDIEETHARASGERMDIGIEEHGRTKKPDLPFATQTHPRLRLGQANGHARIKEEFTRERGRGGTGQQEKKEGAKHRRQDTNLVVAPPSAQETAHIQIVSEET